MAFMTQDTTKFLKLRDHNTERAQGRGHSLHYINRGDKQLEERDSSA